jgi:thioesterase domain-containing protein
MAFGAMARRLKTREPVYGLEFPGLDGLGTPAETVEAMAKSFLGQVRRIQPAGPYRLLGYSFGGLVAFELAR